MKSWQVTNKKQKGMLNMKNVNIEEMAKGYEMMGEINLQISGEFHHIENEASGVTETLIA